MKRKDEPFSSTPFSGELIPSSKQKSLGHPLFDTLFQDIQQWLDPKRWEPFFQKLENQVQVQETNDAYYVTLNLPNLEQPDDVYIQFRNNHLYMKRIVQHEMKMNQDQGAVWKTSYEHFERTIPFSDLVDFNRKQVTVENGVWKLKLPKV
jgi:HSP20 family molecular chaperone IbpA